MTISYAETLITAGKPSEAHKLLLDLLNNVPATAPQLRLIARAANAEGDVANAYFYMSYYYAAIGNLPLAIGQPWRSPPSGSSMNWPTAPWPWSVAPIHRAVDRWVVG